MSEQKERQRAQQVRNSRIAEIMKLEAENTHLRAALAEAERLRPTLDDVRTQRDASDRENVRLRKALAEAERERDSPGTPLG